MPRRSGLGGGFSTLIAGTILIVIAQVLLITTLSFLGPNELRVNARRPLLEAFPGPTTRRSSSSTSDPSVLLLQVLLSPLLQGHIWRHVRSWNMERLVKLTLETLRFGKKRLSRVQEAA